MTKQNDKQLNTEQRAELAKRTLEMSQQKASKQTSSLSDLKQELAAAKKGA
ncbi:hypothetical protein [Arsukibacterium indicum]|uniref:Uncharacterized protein n=1 Tax=Arsukibacterium indicum TaxID=2848612 RepID=A0ABS6MIB9_9GAMM|nr:hypothetical protein [Arsukibacterium indicum]MBV2128547.1 hypothetical protein [Arsukibacterium indicum]